MTQLVPTERYVQMVRDLGIEEAYKQRFRGTGRTIRQVLELAHKLSSGHKVIIWTNDRPGNSMMDASNVLERVQDICVLLGMNTVHKRGNMCLECVDSGGFIRAGVAGSPTLMGIKDRYDYERYELHDC